MIVYWALFAFFALGSLLTQADPRRDKRLGTLVVGWLILVLMIGLRREVGPDWAPYVSSWKLAGSMSLTDFSLSYQRDAGFYGMMWLFRNAGLPIWVFNTAIAIIFTTGLVLFSRTQPNPWLSITTALPYLVIVVAMSGERQATAIGFVMLALVAFQRLRGTKFFVNIGLASALHGSAILVAPLAGLSFTRNKLQATVVFAIVALGAIYFLAPTFMTYSQSYLSGASIKSSGTLVRIGMNAIAAVIFLIGMRYFPLSSHEIILWRNMSVASLASLIVYNFISSTTALDRLVLYLYPLQMVVFSWLPYFTREAGPRVILTMLILLYLAMELFVFLNFGVNKDAYIPYRMFLF